MNESDKITLKQLLFLLINKGFYRCELWHETEYLIRNSYLCRFFGSAIQSDRIVE